MLVTYSINFNPETLDNSIENYIKLNCKNKIKSLRSLDLDIDLCNYIIAKYLIKYLKNHPESRICMNLSISSLLWTLRRMCIEHESTIDSQVMDEFKTNKKLELDLADDKFIINSCPTVFKVYYCIETVLEQLEIRNANECPDD
jgi:hypothetical protein